MTHSQGHFSLLHTDRGSYGVDQIFTIPIRHLRSVISILDIDLVTNVQHNNQLLMNYHQDYLHVRIHRPCVRKSVLLSHHAGPIFTKLHTNAFCIILTSRVLFQRSLRVWQGYPAIGGVLSCPRSMDKGSWEPSASCARQPRPLTGNAHSPSRAMSGLVLVARSHTRCTPSRSFLPREPL